MRLKETVFAIRQHVQQLAGAKLSTGHAYELLASAAGFNSYAELTAHGVVICLSENSLDRYDELASDQPSHELTAKISARLIDLKAPGDVSQISSAVSSYAYTKGIVSFRIIDLLTLYNVPYRGQQLMASQGSALAARVVEELNYVDQSCADDLVEQLEKGLDRYPELTYPLSEIYRVLTDEDDGADEVDPYWYRQRESGRVLTGTEKEWADAYARRAQFAERASLLSHQGAARSVPKALLSILRYEGYDPIVDAQLRLSGIHVDGNEIADIALDAGASEAAEYWLRRAAFNGDYDAMRIIVEQTEKAPTVETWIFIYLGRLLGKDVTKSTMRAYHQDGPYHGQEYDDDFGGNLYVDGAEELAVPELDPVADRQAQDAANKLYFSLSASDPITGPKGFSQA